MRAAPVFTRYALELHLQPATARVEAQARLELRNAGSAPLATLPLQLSSTLHMERVSLPGGAALPLSQAPIDSDSDHTGSLEETAVSLPTPLAPGATLALSVAYSGTLAPSSARLDRLGTPPEVAARSDWDGVGEDWTALRGFGDVVWYPVCSVPALLGQGADLFREIGRQRAVNAGASLSMRVTEEYRGAAPTFAALAGHPVQVPAPKLAPSAGLPGIAEVSLPATTLGFRAPSLVLGARQASGPDPDGLLRVWAQTAHFADAQGYLTAATLLAPLLHAWLPGRAAANPLALVDLPVEEAQPSEQGDVLLASLAAGEPPKLAVALAAELPLALFTSPRPWLNEGVPAFLGTLYAERTTGRTAALERVAASLPALELAEGEPGEDLLGASDAVRYRGKAVYVLWMLRDLAGDKALQAALGAYRGEADTRPDYFESLVEKAAGKDLRWFFNSWVYNDRGLADLQIADVYASKQGLDRWLATVTVANHGEAEVEVPVSITGASGVTTERWRVPGRGQVTRRILLTSEPTEVDVNDGTVPEVTASVHRRLLGAAQP